VSVDPAPTSAFTAIQTAKRLLSSFQVPPPLIGGPQIHLGLHCHPYCQTGTPQLPGAAPPPFLLWTPQPP